MPRTIGLHPTDRYEFKTNSSYRDKWSFLHNKEKIKIIAKQLTYLEFHAWLKDNLKHAAPEKPSLGDWSDLVFDVAEGFHRTDILLYASVCEAALHDILHAVYRNDPTNVPQSLKDCYEKTEDVSQKLNKAHFEMQGTKTTVGTLCLVSSNTVPRSEAELKFNALIRAGEHVGIYKKALRVRLDRLREERNSIHLAQHIRIQNNKGSFSRDDRIQAASVTEDLRRALAAYTDANSK